MSHTQATGRKKLLLAGIVTDVCIVFPALSALAAGYEVGSACVHIDLGTNISMPNGSLGASSVFL